MSAVDWLRIDVVAHERNEREKLIESKWATISQFVFSLLISFHCCSWFVRRYAGAGVVKIQPTAYTVTFTFLCFWRIRHPTTCFCILAIIFNSFCFMRSEPIKSRALNKWINDLHFCRCDRLYLLIIESDGIASKSCGIYLAHSHWLSIQLITFFCLSIETDWRVQKWMMQKK